MLADRHLYTCHWLIPIDLDNCLDLGSFLVWYLLSTYLYLLSTYSTSKSLNVVDGRSYLIWTEDRIMWQTRERLPLCDSMGSKVNDACRIDLDLFDSPHLSKQVLPRMDNNYLPREEITPTTSNITTCMPHLSVRDDTGWMATGKGPPNIALLNEHCNSHHLVTISFPLTL